MVAGLQKRIRQLKEAQENRNTAIKAFKLRVFEEFDMDRALWLRAIRVFAELDCLFSLAKSSTAIGEPSCRPEFVESDSALLDFEELRHPTLCLSTSLKNFIPNDVKLGGDVGKIVLLTGERSIYPIYTFTESELLKVLIWRESFVLLARIDFKSYLCILLSSGKSTVCLFHSSHFDCVLKLYEGYAYDSYGCGMCYLLLTSCILNVFLDYGATRNVCSCFKCTVNYLFIYLPRAINYGASRLSPVDTIITRMGAYDNMFSNSSTFKVELDEW